LLEKRLELINEKSDIQETKGQGTYITAFLTGKFLSHEKIVEKIPYILFLTFIAILYIANGYYAEKTVKQLYRTTNEIKELRSEYISNKSDLELIKQQSHVAYTIKVLELKESLSPPNKIVIKKEEQ
jgi:hypothetical protein